MPHPIRGLVTGSALLLVFALGGCDATGTPPSGATAAPVPAVPATPSGATGPHAPAEPAARSEAGPRDSLALVDEVAATLQAWSYDGEPVRVAPGGAAPGECRDMVSRIMKFTGLPQNFTVVEAPVPNAAAVILLDEDQVPRRVIAFNRDFIDIVRKATGGNAWAPVSIMAHEIGHHLSGHTITPGGSQPPTELEADKFSGFVLFKMGASLDDAQLAMARLVEEGPDGRTHPGRGKRLSAIAEGWAEACVQQDGDRCGKDAPREPAHVETVARAPAPSVTEGTGTAVVSAPSSTPDVPATEPVAAAPHGRDTVPAPGATPSKFDRFVYDAYGYFDATERAALEQRAFGVAREVGVEVVTLLVDDLHGMSAQEYAWAMLRRLRVGKLDVGNGTVVVIAPEQNDAAIAMGPGLLLENEFMLDNHLHSLKTSIEEGWPICVRNAACKGWTRNVLTPSLSLAASGDAWEWIIRDQDLSAMIARHEREFSERQRSGVAYDPMRDSTWRKIVRFSGRVERLAPDGDDPAVYVARSHAENVGPALIVRYDGDRLATLYANPRIAALMPAGTLVEGRRYSFVARVHNLDMQTPQLDLLSYDAL